MKPDIHPKYYPDARVTCACGKTWTTGATQPEIHVDVCFNCHPFYTGEQRIVDTAGRVDRFRMRLAQKREEKAPKKPRGQRVLVVNPDELVAPAPEAVAVVEAPAAEAAPAPVAVSAPAPEIEDVDEVRVRTVVEDESGAIVVTADDDEKPRRRTAARKPRARKPAKAESEPAKADGEPAKTEAEPAKPEGERASGAEGPTA
jgi:large subunit ribosomal protein L31